jgi:DNA-binding transcriptional LysR family regulator
LGRGSGGGEGRATSAVRQHSSCGAIAIGQSLLASVVSRFIKGHPGVTLEWNLRDDAVDVTAAGYDLWIRAGDVRGDDLVVREIYYVRRAIVVSPTYSVVDHPRDLQTTNAVRLATSVPSSIKLTHESGDTFVLKQSAVFTTDNLYAARAAVLEDAGYAILPLWIVQSDLNRGALVQTCRTWRPPDVTLSLAYAPNGRRSARVKALIDYMKAELTAAD